jgi:hypothetical protein
LTGDYIKSFWIIEKRQLESAKLRLKVHHLHDLIHLLHWCVPNVMFRLIQHQR